MDHPPRDTRSGRWRSLLSEPLDDERASSLVTHNSTDSDRVELLKTAAYRAAVDLVAGLGQR